MNNFLHLEEETDKEICNFSLYFAVEKNILYIFPLNRIDNILLPRQKAYTCNVSAHFAVKIALQVFGLFSSIPGVNSLWNSPTCLDLTIMFLWYIGWNHKEQLLPIVVIVKATIEKGEERQKNRQSINFQQFVFDRFKEASIFVNVQLLESSSL